MRLSRRAIFGIAGCAAYGASCKRRSGAYAPDVALRAAQQRLLGRWLLIEFYSDEPLEPVLQALLSAQLGVLTLDFDGSRVRMQGIGVGAERSYEILQAANEQLSMIFRDEEGLASQVVGAFQGTDLVFAALTSPWRGRGRLRKL